MGDPLKILMCTWDPAHTVDRLEAQAEALKSGEVARMIKKHGKGHNLQSAMAKAKLTSVRYTLHKEPICPECGALMEEIVGNPVVSTKLEAARDAAEDFNKAIERTRALR